MFGVVIRQVLFFDYASVPAQTTPPFLGGVLDRAMTNLIPR